MICVNVVFLRYDHIIIIFVYNHFEVQDGKCKREKSEKEKGDFNDLSSDLSLATIDKIGTPKKAADMFLQEILIKWIKVPKMVKRLN